MTAELLRERETFHLEVPADENNLSEVRDFVEEVCSKAGFPKRDANNTKLAVDEACTNIIKHAYKEKSGTIRLDIQAEPGKVEINIFDSGESFDWSGVRDPDLDYYVEIGKKGGLGIYLMNRLMDEISYQPTSSGNRLYMAKEVAGEAHGKPIYITTRPRWTETLRFKFGLRAGVGIFILILILWGILFYRQTKTIENEFAQVWLQKRTIAENIASSSKQAVLDDNMFSVQKTRLNEIIAKQLKKFPTVKYIKVIDANGTIVSSTDVEEFAKQYIVPDGLKNLPIEGAVRRVEDKKLGTLREFHQPIFISSGNNAKMKPIGRVVMGVSEDMVKAGINDQRPMTALLLFGVFLSGLVLIYLLVSVFVKPIQALTDGVRAIGDGTLDNEIKIDGPEEIGEIARAFNEITSKFREAQKNVVEQERLQKEMQVAQEIQHSLLPRVVPNISGYDIASYYKAAKEVGGDYYDFVNVDDDTVGVVVADVSGKGVPGSLVMTMIRTALRMEARGNHSAAEVMARMNDFVTEDMKKGMFVTIFYAILDSKNRIISYASAGHNPMILYRAESDETYFLNPRGFPVGISLPDDSLFRRSIDVEKIKLKKDDMLVIYTDGVTEAMNEIRDQFGEERLIQTIKKFGRLSPQEFIDHLSEEIKKFTGNQPQSDDITVVAIKEKMMADEVLYGIRKKLIDLVEIDGLSVAEACRRMKVSPSTYYRYKRRLMEMGERGLKNKALRKEHDIRRVSLEQRIGIIEIIKKYPKFGAKRIAEMYNEGKDKKDRLTPRLIYDELKRLRLNTYERRLEYLRRNRLITEDQFKQMLSATGKVFVPEPENQEAPAGSGAVAFEEGLSREGEHEAQPLIAEPDKGTEHPEEAPAAIGAGSQETVTSDASKKDREQLKERLADSRNLVGVDVETEELDNEIVLLKINGHLDSSSAQDLEGILESVYEYGYKKVIIDLNDVTYISSGGWGIFTGRVKGLREGEGDVVLVGMSSEVYDIYELLGFQEIIMHYHTLDEAVEFIKLPFKERMKRLEEAFEGSKEGETLEVRQYASSEVDVEGVSFDEDSSAWTPLKVEAGTVGKEGEITVLYLMGVIDTVSSMSLKDIIDSFIDKGNIKLVIDMSRVEYVSSSGWGVFSSRIKEIRGLGGDIKIFGMSQEVDSVFHMLGFDSIMRSFSVLTEAIEDFDRQVEQVEFTPLFERKKEKKATSTDLAGHSEKGELRTSIYEKKLDGNKFIILDTDGAIDSSTSFDLENVLDRAVESDAPVILVDLADVPYISSSGWGIMVKSMQSMEKRNGVFAVTGMNAEVFKIFRDLGFEPLIPHFMSIEGAIDELSAVKSSLNDTKEIDNVESTSADVESSDEVVTEAPSIENLGDKKPHLEKDESIETPKPISEEVKIEGIDLEKKVDLREDKDAKVKKMGWQEYGKRLFRRNKNDKNKMDD